MRCNLHFDKQPGNILCKKRLVRPVGRARGGRRPSRGDTHVHGSSARRRRRGCTGTVKGPANYCLSPGVPPSFPPAHGAPFNISQIRVTRSRRNRFRPSRARTQGVRGWRTKRPNATERGRRSAGAARVGIPGLWANETKTGLR